MLVLLVTGMFHHPARAVSNSVVELPKPTETTSHNFWVNRKIIASLMYSAQEKVWGIRQEREPGFVRACSASANHRVRLHRRKASRQWVNSMNLALNRYITTSWISGIHTTTLRWSTSNSAHMMCKLSVFFQDHKLDAVYDVTAVYPGAKGEHCPQDEKDLLEGKFPEKIHYHIRRFQGCASSLFQTIFYEIEIFSLEICSRFATEIQIC